MTGVAAGGGQAVRIISLNTGGLNSVVKRSKIFSYIKSINADIMFIQETHLRNSDHQKLNRPWIGQVFHSKFNLKTRGVAILIRRNVHFTLHNVLSDINGRYVIACGTLYQKPVVLASVYAPNWDDHSFMKRLLSSIPNLNSYSLILGGDMNCVLDPALDRSSPRVTPLSKSAQILSTFMDQYGYVDPWRFLNPSVRKYSFFSHVHRSFSRIDYFIIDKTLIPTINSIQYAPITISDHSTVILDVHFCSRPREYTPWRLDTLLLSDTDFCKHVSESIKFFCETNKKEDTSAALLWETLKAVIRGQIISYTSHSNKLRRTHQRRLEESLSNLDNRLSSNPTPDLYVERKKLQMALDLLLTREAEQAILHSRGTVYEHGDKAGRLLAHQLKAKRASSHIAQLRDESGSLTSDPDEINNIFKLYYSNLYTSEFCDEEHNLLKFFSNLDMPKISTTDHEMLDAPLNLTEIKEAIKSMNSGKSPGPDGYPVEFYKKFSDQLAPLLLEMFNHSNSQGSLPPTLRQACISLIFKKDKDPLNCTSYRPISLLSVDVKILAKVFARRLETVIPSIISSDQTGFIRERHCFTNIRRLLSIIHTPSSPVDPEVVVSLDAEKAFDRVEWTFLFSCLRQFGFGDGLISWIKLLYSFPNAAVCTNTQRSKFFPLCRGTRQGCPLSPLLFAVAIEPLAIALRKNNGFKGIIRGGVEHKVSLYADDLLLFVRDPMSSIDHILSLLNYFGRLSGYKLNIHKTECFPVNQLANKLQSSSLPFRFSGTGFRYLGVNITKSIKSLREQNLTALTSSVKSDLQRWGKLPLSLAGRVQTVKMNILPRYLYMFQSLPLFLPRSFFSKIDGIISSFIWAGKHARIGKSLLLRNRRCGGLGLPNLLAYYWSANMHKVMLWCTFPQDSWYQVEESSCSPSSLQALVCSPLPLSPLQFSSNPMVVGTLKIWAQTRRHCRWHSLPQMTPICNNHLFIPARTDPRFKHFEQNGIQYLRNLFVDNQFASFDQLCKIYLLNNSDLFRYFQLRSFARSHCPQFPQMPPPSGVDLLLEARALPKGHVSYFYNLLQTGDESVVDKIRAKWQEELQMVFSNEFWNGALKGVNSSSSCARLSLIQFKVLHRLHYCKSRMSRFYPDKVEDRCDRCTLAPCNLTHMFWSCPKLTNFWGKFFKVVSEILQINIPPSPHIAIFGRPPDGLSTTIHQRTVIAFTSLIARRTILFLWKSPSPPSFISWLKDIMSLLKLEKIKFSLRGSSDKFYSTWRPLIDYINRLPVTFAGEAV